MATASRIPRVAALAEGQLGVDFIHFMPDKPSSRAPDTSIKPHGPHWQGAHMPKELEAYPKCS
jgi:hypothetical protein